MESVEKQKQLSHSFHRPLEISQKTRDSHIPTALATTILVLSLRTQKPKKGSRPLRGLLILLSRSPSRTDFMLIVRLENAILSGPQVDDPEGVLHNGISSGQWRRNKLYGQRP